MAPQVTWVQSFHEDFITASNLFGDRSVHTLYKSNKSIHNSANWNSIYVIEGSSHPFSCNSLAQLYTRLGEKEQAVKYLEISVQDKKQGAIYLKVNAVSDTLRADPRFSKLLKKFGFPE